MRASRHWLNRGAIRANAKVRIRELHRFRQMRPRDFAATPTSSEINPTIAAPLRRIDPPFERARAKPGEKLFLHLSHAIAIAVRQEDNVRRARHDHSVARGHESIRRWKIRRPRERLVHLAVAIRVNEQLHHAICAGLGHAFKLLVRLHAAHLRIELSSFVQRFDVELPFKVVTVQFRHKHSSPLVPTNR